MINKQKKTYSRIKSKKANRRKGKSTLLQTSIKVGIVNQDDTLPDDIWKDSFDKLLESRTPLRKNNVIKKVIRASFNLDSSCYISDGDSPKVFKSVSTPVGSISKHKLACKISPVKENQRQYFISTSMYDSNGHPKRLFEYSSEIGSSKVDTLDGNRKESSSDCLEMDGSSSGLLLSELINNENQKSCKASDKGCYQDYKEIEAGTKNLSETLNSNDCLKYVADNSLEEIIDEADIPLNKYKKIVNNSTTRKIPKKPPKSFTKPRFLENRLLKLSSRCNVITSDIINDHNTKFVKNKGKNKQRSCNIKEREYPKKYNKLSKDKENIIYNETLIKNVTLRRAANRNLIESRDSGCNLSKTSTTTSRDNNSSIVTISLISPVEHSHNLRPRKSYKSRRKINDSNLSGTLDGKNCRCVSKERISAAIEQIMPIENVEIGENEVLARNSLQDRVESAFLDDSKEVKVYNNCDISLISNNEISFHLTLSAEDLETSNQQSQQVCAENSISSSNKSNLINITTNENDIDIGRFVDDISHVDSNSKANFGKSKQNLTNKSLTEDIIPDNLTRDEVVDLSQVGASKNINHGTLRDQNSPSILDNTKQLANYIDLHKSVLKCKKINDDGSGNKALRSTLPTIRDLQFVTTRGMRSVKQVTSLSNNSAINSIEDKYTKTKEDFIDKLTSPKIILQNNQLESTTSSWIAEGSELISGENMSVPKSFCDTNNLINSASVDDFMIENEMIDVCKSSNRINETTSEKRCTLSSKENHSILDVTDTSIDNREIAENISKEEPSTAENLLIGTRKSKRLTKRASKEYVEEGHAKKMPRYISSKDNATKEIRTNKSPLNVVKPAENLLQTTSNRQCDLSSTSPPNVDSFQFMAKRSKRTTKNISSAKNQGSTNCLYSEDIDSHNTTKTDIIDLTQGETSDVANQTRLSEQNTSATKAVNDISPKAKKINGRRNKRSLMRKTTNKESQSEHISTHNMSNEDFALLTSSCTTLNENYLHSSTAVPRFEDTELITRITPTQSNSAHNSKENITLEESIREEMNDLSQQETAHSINNIVSCKLSSPTRTKRVRKCISLPAKNNSSNSLERIAENMSSYSIGTVEDSQIVTRSNKSPPNRILSKSSVRCSNELPMGNTDLPQSNVAAGTADNNINQKISSEQDSPSFTAQKILDLQFVTRRSKRASKKTSTSNEKKSANCLRASDKLEDNIVYSTVDRDIEDLRYVTRRSKRTSKNISTSSDSSNYLGIENNSSRILEDNTDNNTSSTLDRPTEFVTRRSKRKNSGKNSECVEHILSEESSINNTSNQSQESITEILDDSNEDETDIVLNRSLSSRSPSSIFVETKQNTNRTPVKIYDILANNTLDLNTGLEKSIVNEVIGLSPNISIRKHRKTHKKDHSNLEDSIDKEEFLKAIKSMASNISSHNISKTFRLIPRKSNLKKALENLSDNSLECSVRNNVSSLQRVYEEEHEKDKSLFEVSEEIPNIILRPGKWRKNLSALRKQNLSNNDPINNSKIQSSVNSTLMPISHDSHSEHLSFLSVTISNRSSRYARKTILESSALAKSIPENKSICFNDGKQLVDDVLLLEPTDDETPKLSTVSLLDNSTVQRNLFISLSGKRTTDYYQNKSTNSEESNETSNERRRTYQHQLSIPLSYRQPSISRRRRTSIVEGSLPRIVSGIPETDTCFSGFIHDPYETSIRSQLSPRDIVLRRCGQSEPLDFSIVYSEEELQQCRKIGEGVYGEVFMKKAPRGEAVVLKIIPIEGNLEINGEQQKKFDEILSEIVIAMELSNLRNDREYATCGFVEVKAVRCVQGRYPDHLIDLWELYRDNSGTENDHPQIFPEDQLYIVLELANGGQDLEAFTFQNALQSYSAFLQTALTLAIAELKFKFEHRDLHWGNILLAPTDEKEISFRINGRSVNIPTYGIKVTIIDYTLSRMVFDSCCLYNDLSNDNELFSAGGDYQFDIYRLMKKELDNQWECFEPYTNVLWLHYTIDKMISGVRYRCSKSKKHRSAIDAMMQIRDELLDYKSASEYVECIN